MTIPILHEPPLRQWLAVLKKAYALMDRAAGKGVADMALRHPAGLACRPGCAHCCRGVIPVSAPELAGAFLYAAQNCSGGDRHRIERRLQERPFGECPFLLNEKCAVYPARFLACRQFFIFGRACAAGEDVWYTRRGDIPAPGQDDKHKAFALLASFYACVPHSGAPGRFIEGVSAPLHLWNLRRPEAIIDDLERGRLHAPGVPESG